MNAYTDHQKGGIPMSADTRESELQTAPAQSGRTNRQRVPVDWQEETIVVNGQELTVLFPEDG